MKNYAARSIPAFLFLIALVACNLPNQNATPTNAGVVATSAAQTLQALGQIPSPTSVQVSTLTATVQVPLSTATLALTFTQIPTQTIQATLTPTSKFTITPSITPIPDPGTIAGSISGYPYGSIPSLSIVAYGQNPPYNYAYYITAPGSAYYSLGPDYLIPGPFQVVAYDASGHAGGCPALITVISNQTVTCNISDWGGSYRSKPSGVPNP